MNAGAKPVKVDRVCTLIAGLDVVASGTLLVAANRDENPARATDPPMRLREHPPLAGGRDRVAGGTWLAVRARTRVTAVLNRRGAAPPSASSRGSLVLEVAAAEDPRAALVQACATRMFAPFTLLSAAGSGGWIASGGDRPLEVVALAPGWHVLTHAGADDPGEPRTAWLLGQLAGFAPATPDAAFERLGALLATHGTDDHPAVCLHDGPMPTVSASRVWLASGEARYEHAEGPPCITPWRDRSALLGAATRTEAA